MSKGPGRVMRLIGVAIAAGRNRRLTIVELAKIAYPDAPPMERAQLVAAERFNSFRPPTPSWPIRPGGMTTSKGGGCTFGAGDKS